MKYNKIIKTIFTLAILVIGTCQISFADIATDAKLQYNKGIDYYQLGQFEEAASCFKKATELDPNYIDAYYNLGSILEYLKNLPKNEYGVMVHSFLNRNNAPKLVVVEKK